VETLGSALTHILGASIIRATINGNQFLPPLRLRPRRPRAPLVHLESHGDGLRQNELAAAVGLDSSSLVRLIDRLEGQGLILRVVDEADRRARLLRLTEAGRTAVASCAELAEEADVGGLWRARVAPDGVA